MPWVRKKNDLFIRVRVDAIRRADGRRGKEARSTFIRRAIELELFGEARTSPIRAQPRRRRSQAASRGTLVIHLCGSFEVEDAIWARAICDDITPGQLVTRILRTTKLHGGF